MRVSFFLPTLPPPSFQSPGIIAATQQSFSPNTSPSSSVKSYQINLLKLYQKCGQNERAVCILEDHLRKHNHIGDPVLSSVDMLASILMESNAYAKVLDHIEHTQKVHSAGKEIPLSLMIKAGICHVHLRQMEKAELLKEHDEELWRHLEMTTKYEKGC